VTVSYYPKPMVEHQKVCRASFYQYRDLINQIIALDPEGRVKIQCFFSFPLKKNSDCNNCEALIFDALAQALAFDIDQGTGNDKGYLSAGVDYEDKTHYHNGSAPKNSRGKPLKVEGFTVVTIRPYQEVPNVV
jgi:hypothetical protein